MNDRKRNRRKHRAAKAYADEHGVSYQQALQTLAAAGGGAAAADPWSRSPEEAKIFAAAAALFGALPEDEVFGVVRDHLEDRTVAMDEFTPWSYVESDIDQATLHSVSLGGPVSLEDAGVASAEGEPLRYWMNIELEALGDIHWLASTPTPGDLDAFADIVEGDNGGGGFLQHLEESTPVKLLVSAEYEPGTRTWSEVAIDEVTMPPDEVEDRDRRHSAQSVARRLDSGWE